MNTDSSPLFPVTLLVWALIWAYLFFVNSSKVALIDLKHRELKEDTSRLKLKMAILISILEDGKRHRHVFIFSAMLATLVWAVLAWNIIDDLVSDVFIVLPTQFGLWERLAYALVLFGAFLTSVGWLPRMIGRKISPTVYRLFGGVVIVLEKLLYPMWLVIEGLGYLFKALGWKEAETDWSSSLLAHVGSQGADDIKLTPVTEKIAMRTLALSRITVYDVLLPRNQVQIFDSNLPIEANVELARKTGHTRFPLCDGDLDQCKGIVHIKDLFRSRRPIEELNLEKYVRPILRFEIEEPLDKVLQVLLRQRVHMALVEDEFGGVLGVITLERILEEMVGEIQDEFDKEDRLIVPLKKDFFRISGMAPLHEVIDSLQLEGLESEEISSFGGLIAHHFGRIPSKGETLEIGPLQITILEKDATRVVSANVRVLSLS